MTGVQTCALPICSINPISAAALISIWDFSENKSAKLRETPSRSPNYPDRNVRTILAIQQLSSKLSGRSKNRHHTHIGVGVERKHWTAPHIAAGLQLDGCEGVVSISPASHAFNTASVSVGSSRQWISDASHGEQTSADCPVTSVTASDMRVIQAYISSAY